MVESIAFTKMDDMAATKSKAKLSSLPCLIHLKIQSQVLGSVQYFLLKTAGWGGWTSSCDSRVRDAHTLSLCVMNSTTRCYTSLLAPAPSCWIPLLLRHRVSVTHKSMSVQSPASRLFPFLDVPPLWCEDPRRIRWLSNPENTTAPDRTGTPRRWRDGRKSN